MQGCFVGCFEDVIWLLLLHVRNKDLACRVVAVDIGLVEEHVHLLLLLGADEVLRSETPPHLLLPLAILRALEQGGATFLNLLWQ